MTVGWAAVREKFPLVGGRTYGGLVFSDLCSAMYVKMMRSRRGFAVRCLLVRRAVLAAKGKR